MKKQVIVTILFFICFSLSSLYSFSQTMTADTTLANQYFDLAKKNENSSRFDSAIFYAEKVQALNIKYLGEESIKNANVLNLLGRLYWRDGKYDLALEHNFKALQIRKDILGEKHPDVAASYNAIGTVYDDKGEYDLALVYHFKALQIRKETLREKHPDVALSYNNIGAVYFKNGEYDKALEYFFKSLQILKEILGEKHRLVAISYNNIGTVYEFKDEYDLALEYHFKALQIYKEIFGEKHPLVATSYINIGNVYYDKCEYDKALEYHFKALQIEREILGKKHPLVAESYNNIGNVYDDKGEYDKALEYFFKALQIRKEILGEKHPDVAASYNNIGLVYDKKGEYDKSLGYYQKGAGSCLYDFNDTVDVYKTPIIRGYLNWDYLLESLQAKAQIIADKNKILSGLTYNDRKKIALRHYQACDTLIDITRKEISTQSDKMTLGEKASKVYKEAIDFLTSLRIADNAEVVKETSEEDRNLAFYFSEKNKSSVLLEALAGQEAMKFAGIPDSLLQKEHNLKIDMDFCKKQLSEPEKIDSARLRLFQNRIFIRNRSYDSLIMVFEKQFPEYHNMKYNNKPAIVKGIQKLLDKKTAMISYVIGDSAIVIFTLTKNSFEVQKVPKIAYLNDSIELFRYGLIKTNLPKQEIYQRIGYKLYQQLFPKSALTDKKIKNLIIIPDGELDIIPFESLLTENYTGK